MDELELEKRINAANKQMIGEEPGIEIMQQEVEATEPLPQKVDIYQRNVNKRTEKLNKSVKHGASTLTKEIAEEALAELSRHKKRADVESDYWGKMGDKERAQIAKDQYMEDHFLPTVEMVIIASTPDEVLNSKDVLKEFDDLTFEYGPGYTASYIRTAYGDQLGNTTNRSDGYVREAVERMKQLANNDQIRAAYGMAKKLKDEVDNGNHTADDIDYEIIKRVATIA